MVKIKSFTYRIATKEVYPDSHIFTKVIDGKKYYAIYNDFKRISEWFKSGRNAWYDAYLNIAKEKQPNAPLPDFENKEGFLAEAYIDKMPCSTFEIYVYSEVKKAFIAGWHAKTSEYNQGVINENKLI